MLKGHADKFHKVCDNKVLVVACHSIGKSTLIKKKHNSPSKYQISLS